MEGNVSESWKKFRRTWNNYEIAAGLSEKEKPLRTATFLICIGSEAMDVFDGLHFDNADDKVDIDIVLQKFETFCIGKTNVSCMRDTSLMCAHSPSPNHWIRIYLC